MKDFVVFVEWSSTSLGEVFGWSGSGLGVVLNPGSGVSPEVALRVVPAVVLEWVTELLPCCGRKSP